MTGPSMPSPFASLNARYTLLMGARLPRDRQDGLTGSPEGRSRMA